ncbi:MAG: glycosyltransferase family A protein [Erysipelotrichaceae bacterium]|nr:glycosyltransferase family A protein [Erysipelotrichaceae bacterium]
MIKLGAIIVTINKSKDELLEIIKHSNLSIPFVLRNQHTKTPVKEEEYKVGNGLIIEANDKGASVNRNRAIEKLECDYFLMLDDDIRVVNNAIDEISSFLSTNSNYDCLAFNVASENPNRPQKQIEKGGEPKSFFDISFFGPCHLCVSKKFIEEKKVYFDELFGPGTKYPVGEDSEFVKRLFDSGAKFYRIPKVYLSAKQEESTYFSQLDKNTFLKSAGITYYLMYGKKWPIFLTRRMFKKKSFRFLHNILVAKKGIREYKRMKNNENTSD